MKKLLMFVVAISSMLMVSCAGSDEAKIKDLAEQYVTAFESGDYEKQVAIQNEVMQYLENVDEDKVVLYQTIFDSVVSGGDGSVNVADVAAVMEQYSSDADAVGAIEDAIDDVVDFFEDLVDDILDILGL